MDTIQKTLVVECQPMELSNVLNLIRKGLVDEFTGYDIFIKSVEPSVDEMYSNGGYAFDVIIDIPRRLYNRKRLVSKLTMFDEKIKGSTQPHVSPYFNRKSDYKAFWK